MAVRSFIDNHIIEALRGSLAELHGDEDTARRLRAETKLRLITMSEEERWALATRIAHPPARTIDSVYELINQSVEQYKSGRGFWIDDLGREPNP